MRAITFFIVVLIFLIQSVQASEHRERKMYVLFVDVEDIQNKEQIEKIVKESGDYIGVAIRREGLSLSLPNSAKRNSLDFYEIRISKSGDYDKKNDRLVGAIQGNIYRADISKNCSFLVIEQENLFSIKVDEEFKEGFFTEVELCIKNKLLEIKKSLSDEDEPLIFLHFKEKPPPHQAIPA